MRGLSCSRAARWLERGFAQQALDARMGEQLRDHLRGCQRCQHIYQRMLELDEELRSPQAEPPLAVALWEQRVLAAATTQAQLSTDTPAPVGQRRWWTLGVPALAGTAFAALLLLMLLPTDPIDEDQFTARQAAAPGFTARALCQTLDVNGADLVAGISQTPGPRELTACPPQGTIFVAYTSDRSSHVYVLGRTTQGERLWLVPGLAGADALEATAASTLSPLPLKLPPSFRQRTPLTELWLVRCPDADCRQTIEDRLTQDTFDDEITLVRVHLGEHNKMRDAGHAQD